MESESQQDEWELSKENVQPLKQGRKFANLSLALQPSTTEQLNRLRTERQQYELALRTYSGDDPLSVWDAYIKWTEQNFPKGGKESNMSQLLEQCVAKFKDEEKYKNDERYLKIWLKFANHCSDALQIFSFLYDQGIGGKLSLLYESWSSELERLGNSKRADMVFEKGIEMGAQPIEHLRKKHSEFQTRVARQAMSGVGDNDVSSQEVEEKERSALGELKAHGKKGRVAHDRVAGAKPGSQRGLHIHSVPKGNSNGSGFTVFSDENTDPASLSAPTGEWAEAPSRASNRENEQKAGVWSSAKVKQRNMPVMDVKDVSRHCQNQFSVFVDENVPHATQTPRKPIEVNQVLSARKPAKPVDRLYHVQHMHEPGDGRPMYPKHRVYAGASEMSLEELRAAEWREKQHRKELKEQAESLRMKQEELERQQEQLKLQQQLFLQQQEQQQKEWQLRLQQQMDEQMKKMQGIVMQERNVENMETSLRSTFSAKPTSADDAAGSTLQSSMTNHSLKAGPPKATLQAPHNVSMNASGHSGRSASLGTSLTPNMSGMAPRRTPETSQTSGSLHTSMRNLSTPRSTSMSAPSPTVNTREAMQVVMSMFNNTLDIEKNLGWNNKPNLSDTEFENQFAATAGNGPEPFKIFTDSADQKPATASAPFAIFDENAPVPSSERQSGPMAFQIFDENRANKENALVGQQQQTSSVQADNKNCSGTAAPFHIYTDKENSAPPGAKNRGLQTRADPASTGDMAQGEDARDVKEIPVKFEPLTMQEKILKANIDWDMSEQTEILTTSEKVSELPDFDGVDMTFAPGLSSTINFTAMARMASTPFNPTGSMASLPEPPISFITPAPPSGSDTNLAMTESSIMSQTSSKDDTAPYRGQATTDKRRSNYVDGAVTNLSPIMEQSDEDKNQTTNKSSAQHHNAFANVTSRDHHASHSHIAHKDNHTGAEHSSVGAPTPRQLALTTMEQSSARKSVPHAEEMDNDMQENVNEEEQEEEEAARDVCNLSRLPLNNMTMHEIDITNYIPPEDDGQQQLLLNMSVAIDPADPFDEELVARFLARLETPISSYDAYCAVAGKMPAVKVKNTVQLDSDVYYVTHKLGEGSYAKVYAATCLDDDGGTDDMDVEERALVLKVQKPACPWEFYITSMLHERLGALDSSFDVRPSIMKIDRGYFYDDGSCLINEMQNYGTLLNLVNIHKEANQPIHGMLSVYLTIELLHIAEQIQRVRVIHGDIKPDNILVRNLLFTQADFCPEELLRGESKILKLIDFGRSIDMDMFPKGTTFTVKVTTSGFQCIEMMTNRPWTYQTDLFGIVGCIHVLVFEDYMKVYKESTTWKPTRIVNRYATASSLYRQLFHDLLNIPSCDQLPDLAAHRRKFEKYFLDNLRKEQSLNEFKQALKKIAVQYFDKGS